MGRSRPSALAFQDVPSLCGQRPAAAPKRCPCEPGFAGAASPGGAGGKAGGREPVLRPVRRPASPQSPEAAEAGEPPPGGPPRPGKALAP